ncbi:amino acid adenylation domain-containing protein [Pseudomonas danubii]|uniref:amino acid adenylation domain-containing protein n=1 Tax=Pseudomonas danubii TaxID=2497146 RepID=UPI00385747F1
MPDNNATNDGPQSTPRAAQAADRAAEAALIAGWNQTHYAYPLDQCLQQLIEQQVQRSPDAVAVCFDDQTLSFCQLNRRANRLAHYLRELGIGPDSLVGVQMERSLELMVALLAILKAGGAYLPLDPGYPEERLALIIDDAAVSVVLTQQRFEHRLKAQAVEVICLDDPASEELHPSEDNPASINSPDDLAYVIYTSGSTGRPKGCMLPHKAICNRLLWMQRHYQVGPAERILQKTPFTFDVSVWELFLPLLSGACLVMARPEGHKDAHYLVQIIQAQQITICHFVPSMLRFFLKHPAVAQCRSLSQVFVSGEALTHDLLLQFCSRLDARLHNLYGPTEAAVDVTWWPAEPRPDQRVPIGRPIDNIQIHILDAESHPVPIGQTGELCIGGVGLARGYLNRPELTAEKFIRDPFCAQPDARLYRTGDEARFLDDGQIEVLGRFDSQVKLRGFRIELGEIENTLKSHPGISDAVVLVQDPGSEDPKLVAYVVAQGLDKKTIRDFVKARLPEYMTPNRVQFVEQIPVTAHGKTDRQALLAADGSAPAGVRAPALEPQALSAWLQQYFIEALGIEALGVDDDLFDQGATSFTLVQAVHSIHQQYQVTLPVEVFLQQPTLAAVIAYILDQKTVTADQNGVAQALPAPRASIQESICLQAVHFDPGAYRRTTDVAAPSLQRLGGLLSLLREVTLEGKGKYLYSSAGGLNAIQCYLYVAQGQVEGLPAGAWYYQPRLNRLLPVSMPAELDAHALAASPLAAAGLALFLVAEMAAIEPIYNHAAPALLVLEAGYIEQLLLSRQADFGIALAPAYGVDVATLGPLLQLQPSHRVLHCLMPAQASVPSSGQPGALFADFLAANNNGFDLPGKDALEQLHRQQRQIRRDLAEQGDGVIELPAAPISVDALQLRAAKRQYGGEALSVAQLSRLLSLLRAEPDSGCLYHAEPALPLKIYLHLAGPTDQSPGQGQCPPPGIYRYHSDRHCLSRIGEAEPQAFNGSYTPFNRKHAQQARLRIFIIGARSAAYGADSRYFNLLQAGRIGQLLLDHQTEFGIGLCPIGSMYFDKVRGAFDLEEGDELLHSFVGGTVSQRLPLGWPRLERQADEHSGAAPEGEGALAIIGISGRYPGAASPQELWQNLSAGRSSIHSVSGQALLAGDPTTADAPQWAVGTLADKQLFDPLLFNITPAEAKTLDPQERLFLQTVWHCLENSGYTAAGLRRTAQRVGVFVGAMWGDYQHHRPGEQGERATSFHSAIANRVSYFNDFNGPSVVFDTSCSSAMTALHFACASIRRGECQAAIVGGVNLISHPSHLELLTSLQLLSAEGQSHPFGRNANGWVAGEGVGALLIRPLEAARREGDQILGVIRATAISHSGKTFRYGTPSAESQAASMRQALEQAGLPAEAIGYVEAAAPGASLADGAEFAALGKVFGERPGQAPLKVGSIKANIGHLESASALSQITKVLLQLQHGQIAPTLGCHPLSPLIGQGPGNLAIADTLSPWQGPRRALINAFGASGSGGHLILEAAPPVAAPGKAVGPWLFPFSAATQAQLEQLLAAFADDLQAGRLSAASLGDISYSLCVGRVAQAQRVALVADSEAQLLALLNAAQGDSALRGRLDRAAPAPTSEADLRGLDRQALNAIGRRWLAGETELLAIARHDCRRVALAAYPFAAIDCHIGHSPRGDMVAPPVPDEGLQTALEGYLKQHFSKVSAIPEASIDNLETFDRYGLTSLMITELNQRLAQGFGELSSTLFFEHQSIRALAIWFAAEHPSRSRQLLGLQAPVASAAAPRQTASAPDIERRQACDEPIAIIGLAGRFPGAPDVERFWDNLKNGVDSISEIPAERWAHLQYYSRDRSLKGKINSKWGGFIDDVDRFDPLFFNISPRDAERMDPQERIFLETAWHTLEDAGYDRAALQRHYQGKMGVFVGVMHGEYLLYTRSAAADCTDDAVDASFGSIANRVSYVFDCSGPSMAIDTICSSSLTALHLAVQSLKRGECRVALAGGVNLSLHPNKYFIQSQLTMSSSDGRCRSFGEGGDGFVPGEGAGAVLLKPLSQAQADGDNIYGVIRATSVNHNGKTHGYTVPSPNAQGAMIAESLEKAGMNPRELSYIEAHGTGTALGDPIEISGLQQGFARRSAALGSEPAPAQQCALGSAKSNIGHLESAAGIAGVAKVLLQLKHRQLAPSLHSSRLNPGIAFDQSPFHIPQQLQEWRRPRLNLDGREREYPLAASVSSFGSGGSNGHVIIAQYLAPERDEPVAGQPALIVLSARTPSQLQQQVERLQQFLQRREQQGQLPRLADLAFTLQQGREALEYRLGFSAVSFSALQERLAQGLAQLLKAPEHFGCFDGLHLGRVQENKAAMAVLAHDEDMAATLAAWADKGKHQKLLELWVKGLNFDWALLGMPKGSVRRISLPGYPFARERIWVSGDVQFPLQVESLGEARLHPLLHRNVSDLAQQKFTAVFSGAEFFLRDHRVGRQKVLPGVAYLEMAREALSRSLGDRASSATLSLCHLVWSQPLTLSEQGTEPATLEIHINSLAPQRLTFEIRQQPQRTLCCQGEALLHDNAVQAPASLASLQGAIHGHRLDAEGLYRLFDSIDIHYGPSHRAVRELRIDGGQVLAQIQLPPSLSAGHGRFVLHPSLMDAALQSTLGLLVADQLDQGLAPQLEHTAVPFALEQLQHSGAALGEQIWAWVRPGAQRREAGQSSFDIDIYNHQGEHCVALQGFVLRELKAPSPLQLMLDDQPRTDAYLLQRWRRVTVQPVPSSGARLLLIANDPQGLQQLTARYPQAATLLLDGSETSDRIATLLGEAGPLEHLLWLAPGAGAADTSADGMIRAQQRGVLGCFRLIKALLALGLDQQPLAWTVITRATLTVFAEASPLHQAASEPVAPAHASVHGLIGVMAKEYSHWPVCLLDLPAGDSWPGQDLLSLPADPRGEALAWRQGVWHRAYLAPCLVPADSAAEVGSLYRDAGVYLVVGGAGGIGRLWSEHLIRTRGARIIWLGRREQDSRIDAAISELARLGPAPRYIRADAGNHAALQQAVSQVLAEHGQIHGVIHAAIQLEDQSLARMDGQKFAAGLAAKVDVCARLAEVFEHQPLDFMLFFSSLQSFTRSAGQSNYAAGCTFKNAFAHYLAQQRGYPVKVINWGYWGEVGSVASDDYRRRMAALGLGSIDGESAMQALEVLLGARDDGAPLSQLTFLRTSQRLSDTFSQLGLAQHPGGTFGVYGEVRPPAYPALIERLQRNLQPSNQQVRHATGQLQAQRAVIDELQRGLLYAQLQHLGCFSPDGESVAQMRQRIGLLPMYQRWFDQSLEELAQHGYVELAGDSWRASHPQPLMLEQLWHEWDRQQPGWLQYPGLKAETLLAAATLRELPQILDGRIAATDILFPDASMSRVEGIYKHNPVSDFFNEVLLDALLEFVRARLEQSPHTPIRILEIGAGTGGTSARAFEKLRPFQAQIAEYCYTDVSQAFLIHAQQAYGPQTPYLRYQLFDVHQPLAAQGIQPDAYDLVIATNVLHATPDLRRALQNAKAALKHNGLLLINEIARNGLFTHLTFGLLKGWWLFDDPQLRLPGGPALAPAQWKQVLESEGYRQVYFPALAEHDLGQQIVIAQSNGLVWQEPIDTAQALAIAPIKRHQPASQASRAPQPGVIAAPLGEVSSTRLKAETVRYLKQVIGGLFKIEPEQIDAREALETYGIDSILVVQLTNLLRDKLTGISSTLFFEYQTVDALAEHFVATQQDRLKTLLGLGQVPSNPSPSPSPTATASVEPAAPSRFSVMLPDNTPAAGRDSDVAIVGLAGRYAQSDNVRELWQHLKAAESCIAQVPADRWDWRQYFDRTPGTEGRVYSPWGGFIGQIDQFDPLFFHLSPREALKMDPQERLFLEEAYHCISDAGYTPARLAERQRVGVFVGVMNGTYSRQSSYWSVANRVSYQFNFQGPSLAVDTACSSSLTALHLAVESLHSGVSDCVLVGGVSLLVDPVHYIGLSEMKMLSSGQHCKAFGADADGFVAGEGVGAMLLKPLAQAEADGDRIYGVIKGSMINAGGKTNGYTVPNPLAQSRLVVDSLARAGVDPRAVSYVEAHGTGTALGDPIEIAGLARAFNADAATPLKQYCAIGSIKSNIGHCESAAGIAGITKVLLQLQHRQLVPSLHAATANPHIDFANSPFVVQQSLAPWSRPQVLIDGVQQTFKRIATVSSFGAGGANAHVVIEEYEDLRVRPQITVNHEQPALILLSAKTGEQLLQQARLLREELEQGVLVDADLPALAFTLQVAREAMEHRHGWQVACLAQLHKCLGDFIDHGATQARSRLKPDTQAPSLDMASARQRGEQQGLLDAWLEGATLDWRLMYPQGTPAPLSLPGYPFARERYWQPTQGAATTIATGVERLHPLLHRNVSDLRGLRYLSRFSGDESVLAEHRVNGQAVLAGAAMIVMIQAALTDALGGAVPAGSGLVIGDLSWRQPFSVDAANNGELFLELSMPAAGDYRIGIYAYDQAAQLQLHCQARASTAEVQAARLDFSSLGAQVVDVEACYQRFAAMGIEYGVGHRRLLSLVRQGDQALARIALQDPALNSGFALHPALLDAAMQGVMALLLDELEERPALLLPAGLGQCVLLADCPASLQVQIRRAPSTAHDYCFDLALFDDQGQCCAILNQLSFQPLTDTSLAASPGANIGLLCHKHWHDARPAPTAAAPGLAQQVLTLGRHQAFADLAPHLAERGIGHVAWPELDYAQAALALAEQLKPWLHSAQPCLIQLLVAADDAHGYRGLGGLLYSVSREQPALICQLIEVAPQLAAQPLLTALVAEAADPAERQLRYLQDAGTLRRQQLSWDHQPLDTAPAPWRPEGVYLITGGLGGVGTVLAREIRAAAPRARVVLCGRTPATAPSVLAKLEQLGAGVDYRAVDLASADQVEQLIAELVRDDRGLHGIIHCAGVTRDALLADKSIEDFAAVFAAKVDGVRHLDRYSAGLALDFFVLYSSIASVLGNPGQTDYAAANGYLDAFASLREQQVAAGTRHGRSLAINWPLWLEGGLHMSDTARRLLAQRSGIEAMASATGVQALYQALHSDEAQLMVLAGDREKLLALLNPEPAPPPEAVALEGDDLLAWLRQLLAKTLKIDPARLDSEVPFEHYGIDSLMIMEMTAVLEKRFGALSKTLFFQYPSLQGLAEHLATRPVRKPPQSALITSLRDLFASALDLPPQQIDEQQCFEDYGLDSLQIVELTRRLQQRFGALPPGLLFEHSSLQALARYLTARAAKAPAEAGNPSQEIQRRLFDGPPQPLQPAAQPRDDIAIIGIAGRYPEAANLEAFWQNLSQGKNSIGEIPPERWDWRDYYSHDRSLSGVHNSKWGGFIDGIDQFDPLFFNISPLEAELIDPQERLFLQTAWSAMEDAGYSRKLGAEQADPALQVGVYAGVMYNEYQLLGAEASLRGQRMGFAGSSASIANRVSFCLNLQGPSLAVDSMCSSSLTALHLACQDLHSGRTAMAIAGGVNLTLHPNKYLMLSSGQFISNQGQCASFGEGGDGYVPGEGVGAVVLKRLADAERDGDQVYGLIKGSYLNHGGKNTGYSVPDPRAQQAAISGALKDAKVDPAAISYIEAHGTGTRLGDPIEIAGLASALGPRTPAQTCWIGSVKSNIGHCEAAAGIAGLTKVLLQLKHEKIVPSLHSQTLNPFIDFAATPFEVNQQLRDWPQPWHQGQPLPRIAGLSSFGAGGSNAHLIVAQYLSKRPVPAPDGQPQMILLSAREPEQLRQIASRLLARLEQAPVAASLAAVAWTLQVGREAMEHRAALITSSLASLLQALRALANDDCSDWICGDTHSGSETLQAFKHRYRNSWHEQLAQLLAKGERQQLLALWSAGLRIDWNALRAASGERPPRISLPTYPFATSRYWAPVATTGLPAAATLHPLLHRNSSTLDRQQFTSLFRGDEPWLLDHLVQGRKTLPGAACLEIIRAAASHARAPGEAGGMVIEQLHWLAPWTLESAPRGLRVTLQAVDDQLAVTLLSDDGEQPLVHCQARVTAEAAPVAEPLDLGYWRNRPWQRRLDRDDVYRLFDAMGLAYGPSHRGIQQLLIAEQGARRQVLAEVHLEAVAEASDCWLEPGITDSVLQAAVGMLLPLDSEPAEPLPLMLPFALQRLEIIAPCARRMWALLRSDSGDHPSQRIDIELSDDQGRLCARWVGFAARALAVAAPNAPTPAIEQLLTPIWSVVDEQLAGGGTSSNPPRDRQGAMLIFGATPCRHQALAGLYPQARLVDGCPVNYDAQLQAGPELADVMWLAPPVDGSEDLIATQDPGVLALFRLIKALLRQGYGRRPLRLTLVTAQAISLRPGEPSHVAHAAVHGLAGSLAKEYPHWQVHLADLEDGQLPRLASAPFAAVRCGEVLALRQGQWWFRQLARVQAEAAPPRLPVYRDGGVYLVIGGAGGIGAVWSQQMISQHRARVVWIGRRERDAQIEAKLDELTAVSLMHEAPAPVYLQVDATDATQLATAKQQITERFGPINGVVHAAIVLKDQSLANMDEATFSQVLNAKVATSVALAQVFADSAATLDFVLFFASMMSFTSAAGQSNYAAGCTFADAFADQLRAQWACPVKVINWGYWGGVGSVSDPRYRERMTALGLGSIEPEEGLRALDQLLAGGLDQLALLKLLHTPQVDGFDSLAGLLGNEQIVLCADNPGAMAAMQDRLQHRLAALAAIT